MKTSHTYKRNSALLAAALAVAGLSSVYTSHAQAIISNGTIVLGVNENGNLNLAGGAPSAIHGTTDVGLRYVSPTEPPPWGGGEYESTSHGCSCEGWGAADAISGSTVFFNNAAGSSGVNVGFVSDLATFATTTSADVGGNLRVTHAYAPSITPNAYNVDVTIENTSLAPQHILYRRVMDWDIEPTAFSEYVTLGGYAPGGNVVEVTNDGFATANPLIFPTDLGLRATIVGNWTDAGIDDHGALFQFDFGLLAPGESLSFTTFYGAGGTEAEALAALALLGAEIYTLGQQAGDPTTGTPATFFFAFDGVGLPPAVVPEPSTVIGGIALAGLAASRLLRRKKS